MDEANKDFLLNDHSLFANLFARFALARLHATTGFLTDEDVSRFLNIEHNTKDNNFKLKLLNLSCNELTGAKCFLCGRIVLRLDAHYSLFHGISTNCLSTIDADSNGAVRDFTEVLKSLCNVGDYRADSFGLKLRRALHLLRGNPVSGSCRGEVSVSTQGGNVDECEDKLDVGILNNTRDIIGQEIEDGSVSDPLLTLMAKHRVADNAFCNICQRCMVPGKRPHDAVLLHLVEHVRNFSFVCPICDKTFAKYSSYGSHCRLQHKTVAKRPSFFVAQRQSDLADVFERCFSGTEQEAAGSPGVLKMKTAETLRQKMIAKKAIGKRRFRFSSAAAYRSQRSHPFTDVRGESRKKCVLCDKQTSVIMAAVHVWEHLFNEEGKFRYECRLCNMKFFAKNAVHNHVRHSHSIRISKSNSNGSYKSNEALHAPAYRNCFIRCFPQSSPQLSATGMTSATNWLNRATMPVTTSCVGTRVGRGTAIVDTAQQATSAKRACMKIVTICQNSSAKSVGTLAGTTGNDVRVCKKCKKDVGNVDQDHHVWFHLIRDLNLSRGRCLHCGERNFPLSQSIHRHLQNVHGIGNGRAEVDYTFDTALYAAQHEAMFTECFGAPFASSAQTICVIKTSPKTESTVCTLCKLHVPSATRASHVWAAHLGVLPPFACGYRLCDVHVGSAKEMESHYAMAHHGVHKLKFSVDDKSLIRHGEFVREKQVCFPELDLDA